MKKNIFFILLLSIIILASCDSGQTVKTGKVASTDLQDITIENMKIYDSIKDIDLSKYVEDSSLPKKMNTYNYTNLIITANDNGQIVRIQGDIFETERETESSGVSYLINGFASFPTIDEVINILGENYYDYWFDREQHLRATTFTDDENQISLTFVYDEKSKNFVWIILSDV